MNRFRRIKYRYIIYLLIIGSDTGSAIANAVCGNWVVSVPYITSILAWCTVLWLDSIADALLAENRRLRNLLSQSNAKATMRKNQSIEFKIHQN